VRSVVLSFPEALYRWASTGEPLYPTVGALFAPPSREDVWLIEAAAKEVHALWTRAAPGPACFPLAAGGHVDHRLCRAVGERLEEQGVPVWYYEDFPYAVKQGAVEEALRASPGEWEALEVDVSETLDARLQAIERYVSQLGMVFNDYGPPRDVTLAFAQGRSRLGLGCVERFWKQG
jgi:LmbE family N-acetylglucosaminyl deacetylase